MNDIVYLGTTTYRNREVKFGIKLEDRRRHFYIIGKTGMGKTTLLENMAAQDIEAGRGIGIIDPHGEFAQKMLKYIPKERIDDVIYFDPSDIEHPIAFNVMEKVDPSLRSIVASGLVSVFKKIWWESWGPRLEYLLRNAILALLEVEGSTLLSIMRLLADKEYRKEVIEQVKDPVIKTFWKEEFARYHSQFQTEAVAPIQNKVGQYVTSPLIRNIVGQKRTSIDLREVMDKRKILIVNLSKGKIGEDNSTLLGALLITKLQLAAMSRVSLEEEKREDFFLYVDEFQNFATESFATILSEARKYRLNLILSHQYISQLPEVVRDAVFGNVGSLVAFRVGASDAEFLEKEFYPLSVEDLCNLPKYHICIKMMIDGVTSNPFIAKTLPPLPQPQVFYLDEIIENSRKKYSQKREEVEAEIAREWLKERETYPAYCWVCQKEVEVPFPPDPKRPVYCKECKAKIDRGEITPPSSPPKSLIEKGILISLEELRKREPEKPKPKPKSAPDLEAVRKALKESLKKFEEKE